MSASFPSRNNYCFHRNYHTRVLFQQRQSLFLGFCRRILKNPSSIKDHKRKYLIEAFVTIFHKKFYGNRDIFINFFPKPDSDNERETKTELVRERDEKRVGRGEPLRIKVTSTFISLYQWLQVGVS